MTDNDQRHDDLITALDMIIETKDDQHDLTANKLKLKLSASNPSGDVIIQSADGSIKIDV